MLRTSLGAALTHSHASYHWISGKGTWKFPLHVLLRNLQRVMRSPSSLLLSKADKRKIWTRNKK